MFVTLEARTPCLLCGFQDRVIMMGTARVNKRSLRVKAPLIGMNGHWRCPECGTEAQGELRPRSRYVLDVDSARDVTAYRARRWPSERCVTDG